MKTYQQTDLNNSLANGDRRRLYLLIGNDEYTLNACLGMITTAEKGAELIRFDALDCDADQLEETFFAMPLMGSRMVVVDNFKTGAMNKELLSLLKDLLADIPDFLTVVLKNYTEGRFSVNRQTEKIMDAARNSMTVVVEQKTGKSALQAVRMIAKREGSQIEPKAAERVLELLGDDLMFAENEIKKLAALANYGTILPEHVERLTVKSTESSVFDIIGALERKNIARASGILSEMLREKTEPLMITASLNTAFVNLYRAKCAAEQGKGERDLFQMFDYRKGDRKVSIAVSRQRDYTKRQLEAILELLYRLDIDLKSSPVDRALLLEQALVEIAAVRDAAEER